MSCMSWRIEMTICTRSRRLPFGGVGAVPVVKCAIALAALCVPSLPAQAAGKPIKAAISPGIEAAAQVLEHFGISRHRLDLRVIPSAQSFYQVRVRSGRLRVEGSSPVAVVRGTY